MASWFSGRGAGTQQVISQAPVLLGNTTNGARQIMSQPTLRLSQAATTPLLASTQPSLSQTVPNVLSSLFVVGETVEYYSSTQCKWIPAKILEVNANGTFNLDCKPDVPWEKIRKAPAGLAAAAPYSAGDAVEYLSATQSKWIPAKVLRSRADGTYDLDCKPEVAADKLRRPFKAGDSVEYFSATQQDWIPAKVLNARADCVYDLDCKPDVPGDKIRASLRAGDDVEYFSSSANKWIPAKVQGVNDNGTYNLDCKPDVLPDKIRRVTEPAAPAAAAPTITRGDTVEYFSATHNRWIPAKVLAVNLSGTFDLDCKPDVPADKIRGLQQPQGGGPGFAAGDAVEYLSATANKWIPAKVMSKNSDGTFNLDCKPDVTADKIRSVSGPRATKQEEPASELADMAFKAGDAVEYFGATKSKWIPAKVVKVNADRTYDLDCKPGVLPDKVRAPQPSSPQQRGLPSLSMGGGVGELVEFVGQTIGKWIPGTSFGSLTPEHRGPGPLAPVPGLPKPVQLLRAKRATGGTGWRYEICADGAAALERFGSRRVAVAAVCGPRQTGKSMLLDALVDGGRRGASPAAVRGGTGGIWLSAAAREGDEQGPLLAFLDCEGFGTGSEDQSRDAQLLALCSLLSSALLLNTAGGSLSDAALAELGPACRFGEAVEERGSEAYRPFLFWVLRDVARQLQDAHGRPVPPDEYMEERLHASPEGQRETPAAREARRSVLHFFKRRTCSVLPPASEERDFKAAVAKLRESVVATCLANPKAVAGQPLSCFSLAQLLRQLAAAASDGRILNIKAAWETVQHTTCGALADELREAAAGPLRDLAAGRPIRGGGQLPLTDEALNAVLRDQRHALKAQWEERAIGEEAVRREYWQELKESLAREEALVRAQNAKLADQEGAEALRAWQEWLVADADAEGGEFCGLDAGGGGGGSAGSAAAAAAAAEEVCRQLGATMERMPARPLSRVSKAAVAAAARRVATARGAVRLTVQRHGDLQRQAVSLGEQAAHQEGAARTELEQKKVELAAAQAEVAAKLEEHSRFREELEARQQELREAEAQLQAALSDLEAARRRERQREAEQRTQANMLEGLKLALEQARAAAARDDAARLAAERAAAEATEAAAEEQRQLREEAAKAREEAARCAEVLASEKALHETTLAEIRQAHQSKVEGAHRQLAQERELLHGEHAQLRSEHQRKVEDVHRVADEQRKAHASALDDHRTRLLERERLNGVLEGKLQALGTEATGLRARVQELEDQVRRAEVAAEQRLQENAQLERDLGEAKASAARARAEASERQRRLEEEHERLRREVAEVDVVKGRGGCSLRRLLHRRRMGA